MSRAALGSLRHALTWALALSWWWCAGAVAAQWPHYDLQVNLDPATRALSVRAVIDLPDAQPRTLRLAQHFRVTRALLDGKPLGVRRDATGATGGELVYDARPRETTTHRIELDYEGTLESLIDAEHRDTLGALPAMAGARGSYLPAGSGWHPQLDGTMFTYRVTVRLPSGQRAVVPGHLVDEGDEAGGWRATFDFAQPIDGIELMAAPYAVSERRMRIDAREVRLRTYFHPEIAELAAGYLDSVEAYVRRYDAAIGAYPFTEFSVVSSPLPTGFGMPGLTYLGIEVLRLPFIRATSLGHEVLHNWWGNGVYADYRSGNWAEGLTTFMADYAYKEDAGARAALDMRLDWLRDLAAVPVGQDMPLRAFTSRTHGTSQIVGYNKAAYVFFMLRDAIGERAFADALRALWSANRFTVASWDTLRTAFESASGRDLRAFFAQWLQRSGAPRVVLEGATATATGVRVALRQAQPPYALEIPLRFESATGATTRVVTFDRERAQIEIDLPAPARVVALDPELRVLRALADNEAPPILRNVMVNPKTRLLVTAKAQDFSQAARALAAKLLDEPAQADAADDIGAPLLAIVDDASLDALLLQRGLPAPPAEVTGKGSARVWVDRADSGRVVAIVAARDAAALQALERGLPHYGRQGWLVFEGGKAVQRGSAAPAPQRVPVTPP